MRQTQRLMDSCEGSYGYRRLRSFPSQWSLVPPTGTALAVALRILSRSLTPLLVLAANATALNQSITAAQASLAGLSLRIALFTIAQNNTFFPDNVTYGDGSAFLTNFASSALLPALRQGDPNNSTCGPKAGPCYAVTATWSQVDGAAVWMWKNLAMMGNFNVTFDVVRLPWSVYYGSSKNDTLARSLYLIDNIGYDGVATSFLVTPDRMHWVRYLIPHQPYGFQVVTVQPQFVELTILSRMFKWTKPFTGQLWGLIIASIVASGLIYLIFEANTGGEDFPMPEEALAKKVMRAIFLSAMSSVLYEGFSPHTHEGRLYTAIKGFVFFVAMSSYIAQYAAILATRQEPFQAVTNIESFASLDKPVCVRQNAAQIAFLTSNYPHLTVQPIPGLTQAGLLPAIVSGVCVGGVGPSVELEYGLGGPGIFDPTGFDPSGSFCGLSTVGEQLNFGYFGIPVSSSDTLNINASVIRALDVLVAQSITTGAYLNVSSVYYPPVATRPQCSATYAALAAASDTSPVLDVADMAGLYLVLAVGGCISILIFVVRHMHGHLKSRWWPKSDASLRIPTLASVTFKSVESLDLRRGSDRMWSERTGMEHRLTDALDSIRGELAELRQIAGLGERSMLTRDGSSLESHAL